MKNTALSRLPRKFKTRPLFRRLEELISARKEYFLEVHKSTLRSRFDATIRMYEVHIHKHIVKSTYITDAFSKPLCIAVKNFLIDCCKLVYAAGTVLLYPLGVKEGERNASCHLGFDEKNDCHFAPFCIDALSVSSSCALV